MQVAVLFLMASTPTWAATPAQVCRAPGICTELRTRFKVAQAVPKDRAAFLKFLALAKESAAKRCMIPGVRVKVPAYRVCMDGGFEERNGKVVRRLPAPLDEPEVRTWFQYLDGAKFKEGRAFTRGRAFGATLDGDWAEEFGDPIE
jgi:hypothetical protein